MTVYVYPADEQACGHFRLIWPVDELRRNGHPVEIISGPDRQVKMIIRGDRLEDVHLPGDAEAVVFQRVTHLWVAQAIGVIRAKGIAVVVDIDDDLSAVHPNNPAWSWLHPRSVGTLVDGKMHLHSWNHLHLACRDATLVTVSTPELLRRYARHGRGRVLYNRLPDRYLETTHEDSDVIGWPASLHSHPNDPDAVGSAISRLVNSGLRFKVVGDRQGCRHAFSLTDEPETTEGVDFEAWPSAVTTLGIGIAPLADTRFNAAKSWLKPLELAGCGVPWVGSPRPEYRRLHSEGCGMLADRPNDWFKILRRLSRDVGRRVELSEAGLAVARRHRLSDHAWRWWEVWQSAIELERETRPRPVASR